MEFMKLHLGANAYAKHDMERMAALVGAFASETERARMIRTDYEDADELVRALRAVALCHNVTPVFEAGTDVPSSYQVRCAVSCVVCFGPGAV